MIEFTGKREREKLKTEIKADIIAEIKAEITSEIKAEIEQELKNAFKEDLKREILDEIKQIPQEKNAAPIAIQYEPNEPINNHSNSIKTPSQSNRLDTKSSKCAYCNQIAQTKCVKCGRRICLDHLKHDDPRFQGWLRDPKNYCLNCYSQIQANQCLFVIIALIIAFIASLVYAFS